MKPAAKEKKKFKMPSAYVIIFFALLIVVILTWFVPVSVRDTETGDVIYNAAYSEDGSLIMDAGAQPKGLWDFLMAPVQGFISASDVGIALLVAGGFLNVLNVSGGLEAGIGKMLKRLKGNALIALMTLVFAIMGTVFGFWEEITAFALVVVPLFVLAGYDAMTGLAVLFVGASVGNMASVVNPFSTGAAVAAINNPDLTLGSGIILRAIIFVVLYVVGTLFVIRYAAMVKKDMSKSVVADVDGIKTGTTAQKELPEMTPRRLGSVIVFILVVLFLLIGYIPWQAIGGDGVSAVVNAPLTWLAKVPVLGNLLGAGHVTPFGDWGFNEFSFLFLIGALLLMLINRMKADEFIGHFLDGAKDLLGVVLVLAISRGIAIVMGSSTQGMSVTFVYWISNGLAQAPLWIFALLATAAYVLIGLFLQSTSGGGHLNAHSWGGGRGPVRRLRHWQRGRANHPHQRLCHRPQLHDKHLSRRRHPGHAGAVQCPLRPVPQVYA